MSQQQIRSVSNEMLARSCVSLIDHERNMIFWQRISMALFLCVAVALCVYIPQRDDVNDATAVIAFAVALIATPVTLVALVLSLCLPQAAHAIHNTVAVGRDFDKMVALLSKMHTEYGLYQDTTIPELYSRLRLMYQQK